jgi:nitrite reductase/ring-hydroxylating ferredoxin subunit
MWGYGWRYDVTSGLSLVNPAAKVLRYRVEVQVSGVFVELP